MDEMKVMCANSSYRAELSRTIFILVSSSGTSEKPQQPRQRTSHIKLLELDHSRKLDFRQQACPRSSLKLIRPHAYVSCQVVYN